MDDLGIMFQLCICSMTAPEIPKLLRAASAAASKDRGSETGTGHLAMARAMPRRKRSGGAVEIHRKTHRKTQRKMGKPIGKS